MAELRALVKYPWPTLTLPSSSPAPPAGDSYFTHADLKGIDAKAKALRDKACPHCGRAVKDVGFSGSKRSYRYVFTHEDRLCGGDDPRIFLYPEELQSIEEQVRALSDAQEATRFARSWLAVLADEIADLEAAVNQSGIEAIAWLKRMCAAAEEFVRCGSRLPRGAFHTMVQVDTRLREKARLLGKLLAELWGEAKRTEIERLQSTLADLVTPFDSWRETVRARTGELRRKGKPRRPRLVVGSGQLGRQGQNRAGARRHVGSGA